MVYKLRYVLYYLGEAGYLNIKLQSQAHISDKRLISEIIPELPVISYFWNEGTSRSLEVREMHTVVLKD